ncbi:hypothetical protein [Kocuria rosea]|uniref:hypothetical protein n=1 Tax=Kocuria rosea TaxID=1275 RepID=UPI002B254126|nr:hypothetical protein [Kocuria rosea]MEB2619358.1 hypothetical protein [Kocuria rosea]
MRVRTRPLRTRLLLVMVGLLAAVCAGMGLLGQAALDLTLTRQLDGQLFQSTHRVL